MEHIHIFIWLVAAAAAFLFISWWLGGKQQLKQAQYLVIALWGYAAAVLLLHRIGIDLPF